MAKLLSLTCGTVFPHTAGFINGGSTLAGTMPDDALFLPTIGRY
jgi:hypothetical protein